ncbi:MAG: PAS domain-containing protein [Terracidiphilus sp.]
MKFVGTTTDIDDQKRVAGALGASEANLRRVIDTIPSLSWCNLPDGPNEFLSKGWHDYTGMSPEEAHGWGWSASFHPDDLPPLMNRWQELLVSGERGEIEARIRRHDGEYRWFLIRVAPFHDESGAILRWYGTSTDIHDRKLVEEALRASEAQLRLIIDSTPGFLGVLSPAGEVEFVSRQTFYSHSDGKDRNLLSQTPEYLFRRLLSDFSRPLIQCTPKVVPAVARLVERGSPKRVDRGFVWVKLYSRIEEIEIEHH